MGLFDFFDFSDLREDDLAHADLIRGRREAGSDFYGCTKAPFDFLHQGDAQVVDGVTWRENDPHARKVFNYRYITYTKNGSVSSPSYTCATGLANASWPYLSITPNTGFPSLDALFDGHHAFKVLDPAFSAAFKVDTTNDRFADVMLPVEMRYFLLDHARALSITFNQAWFLVYAREIPTDLVANLFPFIDDLLNHIPSLAAEFFPPPLPGDLHTPMPSISPVEHEQMNHPDPDDESRLAMQYDLDGNPIKPHEQDPWGDGRPLPPHGPSKS